MKIRDIQAWPVWDGQRNFLFVTVDTIEHISQLLYRGGFFPAQHMRELPQLRRLDGSFTNW